MKKKNQPFKGSATIVWILIKYFIEEQIEEIVYGLMMIAGRVVENMILLGPSYH